MEAFGKKRSIFHLAGAVELKGQAYRPSKHYGLAFLVNGHTNAILCISSVVLKAIEKQATQKES